MEKMTLIHWTGAGEPGEPWESGWAVKPLVTLPASIVQGRAVYRAPAGTQLPEGAEPYQLPVPTAEQVEAATAHLEECLDQALCEKEDGLVAIIRSALSKVADEVMHAAGLAFPLAEFAPPGMSIDQAAEMFVGAWEYWITVCSHAVIRPAPRGGYSVWAGMGSLMELSGIRNTYDDAEQLAVDSVEHHRAAARAGARRILAGWCDDLPIFGGTLGGLGSEYCDLPIQIHRGPMEGHDFEFIGSLGLPVVAIYQAGQPVQRFDHLVTWDDEACWRAYANGHASRLAMTRRAAMLLIGPLEFGLMGMTREMTRFIESRSSSTACP